MKRIDRRLKTPLILVATVLILTACGQRGPLFLPQPEPEPAKSGQTEANETMADKAEDESEDSSGA